MRMLPEVELLRLYVAYARERTTAGSDLTRVTLARSGEHLEQSRKLLDEMASVPRAWPKPSKKQ
jgi:hypothetical protein